jgi:alkylation response protein AidB-like acyl-CoA dehydrogenase
MMRFDDLEAEIRSLAKSWSEQRSERQQRRHLDRADFDALAEAGFLLTMVPQDQGGLWEGVAGTTRPLCRILRSLGTADPSVALVASMHPAVLSYWMANASDTPAWRAQLDAVVSSVRAGCQWGTVTSEPGSGGDIARTRTVARAAAPMDGEMPGKRFLLTGDKHFGSGTGITHYMVTTARAGGDVEPAIYFMDLRQPSDGYRIVAEWDGAGMTATQSHAVRLEAMPAVRMAWDRSMAELQLGSGGFILALFTSVVLGILDAAVATAAAQLRARRESLGSFETTEWSRAEREHWLAVAAWEHLLDTIESGDSAAGLHAGLRAKISVAELAESALGRICRVIGGGSYARRSPFSHWFEDVRALGFLRPPWALAADNLYATSLA